MRQLVLYIHGKGGNAMEADHYKTLFAGSLFHFTNRWYGKADSWHDGMGGYNGRKVTWKTVDNYRIWRNIVLGIFVLCA